MYLATNLFAASDYHTSSCATLINWLVQWRAHRKVAALIKQSNRKQSVLHTPIERHNVSCKNPDTIVFIKNARFKPMNSNCRDKQPFVV